MSSANWVSENTTTTGTGLTVTLNGASSADFTTFASQVPSGSVVTVSIRDGNNREMRDVLVTSGTPWTLTWLKTHETLISGVYSSENVPMPLSGSAVVSIVASRESLGTLSRSTSIPFTAANSGFHGAINTTTSTTIAYLQAMVSGNTIGPSTWVGEIIGTDCFFFADNSAHTQTNFIFASVDGSAPAAVTGIGGKFPIFTKLQDTKHLVKIQIGSAYGATNANVSQTGNLLEVHGVDPTCSPPQYSYLPSNSAPVNVAVAGTFAATPASYTPATSTSFSVSSYSCIPSTQFTATTRRIIVSAYAGNYVFMSIDGALPVRFGPQAGGVISIPCDGISHVYTLWANTYSALSIGVDNDFSAMTVPKRLFQFGDSITLGAYASTQGNVETFGAAAALGCVGSTQGMSGQTVEGLYADMTNLLAGIITNATSDVAVLAIGRNNTGAGWTSTTNTDYAALITQLRTKFNKVICRGILNGGSGSTAPYLPSNVTWPTENGYIQTLVTAAADPNVTYVDPTAWTDVAMANGTHPADAGYTTLIGHCVTAYTGKI